MSKVAKKKEVELPEPEALSPQAHDITLRASYLDGYAPEDKQDEVIITVDFKFGETVGQFFPSSEEAKRIGDWFINLSKAIT